MSPRPASRNALTLRLGRWIEARATGWGLVALVVLAALAAGIGVLAPGLLGR